ncbi:decapping and exoribonuclease protein-like isoform X2 [Plodia interpunctella]|uniref:decapping and exoribonuclease protein-like isoform X2 n=1 Tax=Plodia interpunctella TaxID=58824 RepID=UPI00236866B5|nr:decapping and exoribonuclease protein-like isoform X2 [Plodia interpunctella]
MQPELYTHVNNYTKAFPRFSRPQVLGYIGLENLKFARQLQSKRVHFDLNLHIDKCIHRPPDLDVKLTELLRFLLENEKRLNFCLETNLDNSKFFCYRGLMTCLALTPYENKDPWKIVVILFKGNIYLCARDTEESIRRKKNMTEHEKKCSSWGYKFEQFVLSDKPHLEPNPNIPVDENEEFSLVFTTKLNIHTIVYGAEMDGIHCDLTSVPTPPEPEAGPEAVVQYLSNAHFVELKTSRHIEFPRQETSFRFKTKKWWCQSFLAGIDTILCGYRNDEGIVEELKTFQLRDLVKMSERFWNPNVCFNFLDDFFTYVKRCLAREIKHKCGEQGLNNLQTLPMISLLLEWSPGNPVRVTGAYNNDDDPILPNWFCDDYGKNRDI